MLAIGGIPHGLAVDAGQGSEQTLYVTDRSRDLVRRLRVANAGDSTLQLGERVLAVAALPESVTTASGRVAVAAAHGGAVEVFDPSGTPLGRAEVGARSVRVAFDPEGAWLAAALSANGEVALIDRGGAVRRVQVGGVPDGLAFTADGR